MDAGEAYLQMLINAVDAKIEHLKKARLDVEYRLKCFREEGFDPGVSSEDGRVFQFYFDNEVMVPPHKG